MDVKYLIRNTIELNDNLISHTIIDLLKLGHHIAFLTWLDKIIFVFLK